MKRLMLSILTVAALLSATDKLSAQFVTEKSISDNEATIDNQRMRITVLDEEKKKPISADLSIKGLNPRKTVSLKEVIDTSFAINNYRLYTVSCVKEGYMMYSEQFWPQEAAIHNQPVMLKPLEVGLSTTVPGIRFLGNQTEIYHKSKPSLDELVEFLTLNPSAHIMVIGHVNGPDNEKSPKFYRKASEERAESVRDYLISRGVNPKRLDTEGRGNMEMVFPDPKTDWENDTNRRVEIQILKV